MGKILFNIILILFIAITANAQDEDLEKILINGEIVTAIITETDTIIIADLEEFTVTAPREFENRDEYRRYLRYRKYASDVYPYAIKAIRTYREMEEATAEMTEYKKKRYIKKLQKRLTKEFKDPLKKLTRTRGLILTKMIEKELDISMHNLLRELKGGITASYYTSFSKLYGYDLKKKYVHGEDKIMDSVLNDFDISYEIRKKN